MKKLICVAVIALAGCEPAPPSPPRPEMVALQTACVNGDTQACAVIAQLRQRADFQRRQAIAALGQNMQSQTIDPGLFQTQQPTRTVCQPSFGGQVVCTTQ